jgi:site-specific DNA-methyltransferase (adenine-specific)
VTIYHGDCREVDAWDIAGGVMVTDPPYGMGHRSGKAGAFGDCSVAGDETTEVRDQVLKLWAPRPALVFGRWSVPKPLGTKTVLTWDKGELIGMGDLSLPWGPSTEEIYVLGRGFVGKRGRSVLRYQGIGPYQQVNNGGERFHPTQKPVELLRDLIGKCPPLAEVVDPFMGSGSTLRAAKDCGRTAIGIEIEERYCEVAAKRMAQEVLSFALSAEAGDQGTWMGGGLEITYPSAEAGDTDG